ncbi:MAG: T9SS type A sorting domain-containing protein [Bacteroidia bacterium]
MKKILPFVLYFMLGVSSLQAQTLKNSIWLGTKPPSPNLWFWYSADTLYYSSTGNGNYIAQSLFSSPSGQLEIRDLTGSVSCMDTGFYTFIINGNNCVFTAVTDLCVSRRNTLTQYTWTFLANTSTGLNNELAPSGAMPVFPNPTSGLVYLPILADGTMAEVYDTRGRCILKTIVESGNHAVDLSALSPGLYLIVSQGKTAKVILY